MAYLGDFLGALTREVALSRVQSDTEAVRVAELYARDPLLKHFPVPRFRLPTVMLRVPVAVESLDPPRPGTVGGGLDGSRLGPLVSVALGEALTELGMAVSPEARREVERAVAERVEALLTSDDLIGERAVAEALAEVAAAALPPTSVRARLGLEADRFKADLQDRLRAALIGARVPPPRLRVLVNDAQLREATDNLVHIDLTLNEEAVEWIVVDQIDGRSDERLVPE